MKPYEVVVHPDIWTKLTAIGTIGAVAMALILAVWSGVAARVARVRLDDREAKAEARKVVILITSTWEQVDGTPGVSRDWVEVVNAGDEPIVEARMLYGYSHPAPHQLDWQWMHGNGGGSSYTPLILAYDRYRFSGDWRPIPPAEPRNPSNADRGGFYGIVTWSDSRNRHWVRSGREQPVELQEPLRYEERPTPRHRKDADASVIKHAAALADKAEQRTANLIRIVNGTKRNL